MMHSIDVQRLRPNAGRKRISRKRRPKYEALERRVLLTTFTVSSTGDSGAGTLRQAILDANATAGADTIHFNIAPAGSHTLMPLSELPVITEQVAVDGSTQPGFAGTPIIELRGDAAGTSANGLAISGNDSTVRGLVVNRFGGAGLLLTGNSNIVTGNYIGTDLTGNTAQGNQIGILIDDAANNIVGGLTASPGTGPGNVISGNTSTGLFIQNAGSDNSVIQGNIVGLGADGTTDLGNAHGITITQGENALIGGTDATARNVISGNTVGINFSASGSDLATVIQGNYIGTDVSGNLDRGNSTGIGIGSAPNTTVGGTVSGAGNVISGNNVGISTSGISGTGSVIQGNIVGLNVTGSPLGNNLGIQITTANNLIGGTASRASNVIAGNNGSGLEFSSPEATNNIVAGNVIGTDSSGAAGLGNQGDGIHIRSSASGNYIGGAQTGAGNVISGNANNGVLISPGADGNFVQGNLIGTDASGTLELGNAVNGVSIEGAFQNLIGGSSETARNLISANDEHGVSLTGVVETVYGLKSTAGATGPTRLFSFNSDGTGLADLGAVQLGGLDIQADALAYSSQFGLLAYEISAAGSKLLSIDPATIVATTIGSSLTGREIRGATFDRDDQLWVIDAATDQLLQIDPTTGAISSQVTLGLPFGLISSSDIAVGADGTVLLTQSRQIYDLDLQTGATTLLHEDFEPGPHDPPDTLSLAGAAFTMHGRMDRLFTFDHNTIDDIYSYDVRDDFARTQQFQDILPGFDAGLGDLAARITTPGNRIQGNYIGTDINGTTELGNADRGVSIGGSHLNVVGTDGDGIGDDAEGNVISGNLLTGSGSGGISRGAITISGTENVVAGNLIGPDATGLAAFATQSIGIYLLGGAARNRIGTDGDEVSDEHERNVISGNTSKAIDIRNPTTRENVIAGNFIGVDISGSSALANQIGVTIDFGSDDNLVGTDGDGTGDAAERNIISGNLLEGVVIGRDGTTGNVIAGNYIGTDVTGTVALGNGNDTTTAGVGIRLGASSNLIGSDGDLIADEAERNLISGNNGFGIDIRDATSDDNVVRGNYIGTNPAGDAAVPNTKSGVLVNQAGGTRVEGNLVSGNDQAGIAAQQADGIQILGNTIGTNAAGGNALGNAGHGISIEATDGAVVGGPDLGNLVAGNLGSGIVLSTTNGSVIQGNWFGTNVADFELGNTGSGIVVAGSNNTIGGSSSDETNFIRFNQGTGLTVASGTGNSIVRNSTSDNGSLGIDLGNDGATANDAGDADVGANNLQNSPDILDASVQSDGSTRVVYNVTSDPANANYPLLVEFSLTDVGGTQGQTWVASATFTQSAFMSGSSVATIPSGLVLPGDQIVATATDAGGNSSEFSAAATVSAESVLLVTNTSDSGLGSLRQAMLDANNTPGFDLIAFAVGSGAQTIQPLSQLPAITDAAAIDGTSQPGFAGTPIIVINGLLAGGIGTDGLVLEADGSLVRGLVIQEFGSNAIRIASNDNVIEGNYLGTDISGNLDQGNQGNGVLIADASGNRIGGITLAARNVISANDTTGITIVGIGANNNLIQGNLIGTNAAGTADLGNSNTGIVLADASGNTIGGATPGARNVISGNDNNGVSLNGVDSTGNFIYGNYIGTDVDGSEPIGNATHGVRLSGARDNEIGGTGLGQGNVISGNLGRGIDFGPTEDGGPQATGNLVAGNLIGTDAAGTAALGNSFSGVAIVEASENTIGGTTPGARNVISANANGVNISLGSSGNVVLGNYIGTDVTGTQDLGNEANGVIISRASGNTVGGSAAGSRNVISGNDIVGLTILGPDATANVVQGNYIGTDASGTVALANLEGIRVFDAAENTIGGVNSGNVVSGNATTGLRINGVTATNNLVQGNLIGTDATGSVDLGNQLDGLFIQAAPANTVGGTEPGAGNVISGNERHGVVILAPSAVGNVVVGNRIGTDVTGSRDLGNSFEGVTVSQAPANIIGGDVAGAGNTISGNDGEGIQISGVDAHNNRILGNFIGTDATGIEAIANGNSNGEGDGVRIIDAPNTIVGGGGDAARNVISGNLFGVVITGVNATNNEVSGNYIGTDVNGTSAIGNAVFGVHIIDAPGNTIGGNSEDKGNVISGNVVNGVDITGPLAVGNLLQGNFIGTDLTGTVDIGNGIDGVVIHNDAASNIIGGSSPGARNVISGNERTGLLISEGANLNRVEGNLIGTDATGTQALGNTRFGVDISRAANNTIGGSLPGSGNLISGNLDDGVIISGGGLAGTTNNVVIGNKIGLDLTGVVALPNQRDGVEINGGAQNNRIGSDSDGENDVEERNLISGNLNWGVLIEGADSNIVAGNYIGTDISGALDRGNALGGVTIKSGSGFNVLGGSTPTAGNLISGNDGSGVTIEGAANNRVEGNLIGTDAVGLADLGNSSFGVDITSGQDNVVGGTDINARNVISGNDGDGVIINSVTSSGNRVEGNYIGTDVTGSGTLGNSGDGVRVVDSLNNRIGGSGASETNLIGFNSGAGVTVVNGTGNAISQNALLSNVGLGIDLGADGPTPNDPDDADGSPNNFQNFPELSGAIVQSAGTTEVTYRVPSDPANAAYPLTVEFFQADDGGEEGRVFLGSTTFTAAEFTSGLDDTATLLAGLVYPGDELVATATDAAGNTSEFSVPISAAAASSFVVTNTNDSGAGSLRQALIDANSNPGFDLITFNIGSGPQTIQPLSLLNPITDPVAIDGTSQPGFSGTPLIEIDGSFAGTANGIVVYANDSLIQGLVVNSFGATGIRIEGDDNVVRGNYVGTTLSGTSAKPNVTGIYVFNASRTTIGGTSPGDRNIVSGNSDPGIDIYGPDSANNVVQGNYIGTDVSGDVALPNGRGVLLFNEAHDNLVGGTDPGAGNVISGNAGNGMVVAGPNNIIQGNFIGTDKDGEVGLGNSDGIGIADGAPTVIGGTMPAARNVISGNTGNGILALSDGNIIRGNFIGTDATGTVAIGTGTPGFGPPGAIFIVGGSNNTIGGTEPGAGNLISGNALGVGIVIGEAEATNNVVQGNKIGTDITGILALPNQRGIKLENGTTGNTIGGTAAGARNVISANLGDGIQVVIGSDNNVIQGNYIGTDVTGTQDLGNEADGISLATANNIVGGTTPEARNIISGNSLQGICLIGPDTTGNVVLGNYIGVAVNGVNAMPNDQDGVAILDASGNTIGGSSAGARNIISGNRLQGLLISGGTSANNTIEGNYIGTDASGTQAVPNEASGIFVEDAAANTIGGATPAQGNIISGNADHGIFVSSSTEVILQNNLVGTDATGTSALGNGVAGHGIHILDSTGTQVGGPGVGNVISGNNNHGLSINGSASSGTVVQDNLIGVSALGNSVLANTGDGIFVNHSPANVIGGTQANESNTISGNQLSGITIRGANATGNAIVGNKLGTDSSGSVDMGNVFFGVYVEHAPSNIVGGTDPGSGNVISGNQNGITIGGSLATGNLIQGNFIGTDAGGTKDLGNESYGIFIVNAPQNTVGGTTESARNVISGNDIAGLVIAEPDSTENVVFGNFIGTDVTGSLAIGNRDGVEIIGAGNNTIGGAVAGAGNLISGNNGHGVNVFRFGTADASGNMIQGNLIGVDTTGEADLGNTGNGVILFDVSGNTIGGDAAGTRNVISGNDLSGIEFFGAGATANTVQGNYLGTNSTGTGAIGNTFFGLFLNGAEGNNLGGTKEGAGNLVSGNQNHGVVLLNANNNFLQGNYVGTNAAGTAALANGIDGVHLIASSGNHLGGDASGAGNLISGNPRVGLGLNDGSNGNTIQGNTFGIDASETAAVPNAAGLVIQDSADNLVGGASAAARNFVAGNLAAGLTIRGTNAQRNLIQNNYIGDVHGTGLLANGSDGVVIDSGAAENTIGGTLGVTGNVISGNANNGITVSVTGGNTISGNLIGTDPSGTIDRGNGNDGINIFETPDNIVGGADPQLKNIVSGNDRNAVLITGLLSTNNQVLGNLIGVDLAGLNPLPNLGGVGLVDAPGNTIGGTSGAGNVITANETTGILLRGAGTANNVIQGNTIGDSVGTAGLANAKGILIDSGARNNLIGGTAPGEENIISGNAEEGVLIANNNGTGNRIEGNLIGTDATGSVDRGNTSYGVAIFNSPGTIVGPGNVISGNDIGGVDISGITSTDNQIIGNFIGTNASGSPDIGNESDGIRIQDAPRNQVGGAGAAARNVISGNARHGIAITQSNAANNVVMGNYIGLAPNGVDALQNGNDSTTTAGISIFAPDNVIGGTGVGEGNVISGNHQHGILIFGEASQRNKLLGNFIGTTADASASLANQGDGVRILDARGNEVGGTEVGAGNVISGNTLHGLAIFGESSSDNAVQGNFIGTNSSGDSNLGNGFDGIQISDASRNQIGGRSPDARNVISGNVRFGIAITQTPATENVVRGNYIGTTPDGDVVLGNGEAGLSVGFASFNQIGGTQSGDGNVIAGNDVGIWVNQGAAGNNIQGNLIGTNATGTAGLSSQDYGILVNDAPNNLIGGLAEQAGNVISAHDVHGILIQGVDATGNLVQGNLIGTDVTGTEDLGNGASAVALEAPGNTVGGESEAARNVLSGNASYGIALIGDDAHDNLLQNNFIGTDATGKVALRNDTGGIFSDSARDNLIFDNLISGNGIPGTGVGDGIQLAGVGGGYIVQGNQIGTDIDGTTPLGNEAEGIQVSSSANQIGGRNPGEGNLVSDNRTGIFLRTTGAIANAVEGNVVGLDATGQVTIGNEVGISLQNATNNTIGGSEPGAGNIISGSTSLGVFIDTEANNNSVLNNRIGTNLTGDVAIGNAAPGIDIKDASGNLIAGNTIAGNQDAGVQIRNVDLGADADRNFLRSNFIGTNEAGADLGNVGDGVRIDGGESNEVGGPNEADGNVIRANTGAGVVVVDGIGNLISHNSFDSNGALAIDLGNDGQTPNDADDADDSPNRFQNSPEFLSDLTLENGVLTLSYEVRTLPANATYPLTAEFYIADAARQEGKTLLFSDTFNDADIGTGKTLALLGLSVEIGDWLVATATDAAGNTSEFSASRVVRSSSTLTVDTVADSGAGSLRDAINTANARPGKDTIHFNILSGPFSIQLMSPLPAIIDPVVIDATTQPDFDVVNAPVIELDGSITGMGTDGFVLQTDDSEIKGFVINRFNGDGIQIEGNGNQVSGNFIGTTLSGGAMSPNQGSGVHIISGSANVIGDTNPLGGNVISGNVGHGVFIEGSLTSNNLVVGNLLGTDPSNTLLLGNMGDGIFVEDSFENVLGSVPGHNVIVGNANGITIRGTLAEANLVQANLIGTNAGGLNLGNLGDGVRIEGASTTQIGGGSSSLGNALVFNSANGISIVDGLGNAIRRNMIDANGGLGIDLGNDGVTANDPLDADGSPNAFQNFPVISSALFGPTTVVSGSLFSQPATEYIVDFYASSAKDASGYGEGGRHLGQFSVTTDAFGAATFFGELSRSTAVGEFVSATATGPDGTSEFSLAVATGNNVAPTVDPNNLNVTIVEEDGFGFPVNRVLENQLIQLFGSFEDPDFTDSHTVTISWGDGTQSVVELEASDPPQRVFGALHQYRDDDPTGTVEDQYTILVEIRDNTGANQSQTTLFVKNAPPEIDKATLAIVDPLGTAVTEIDELDTVRLVGSFEDPGRNDTHTVEVVWGDGVTQTVPLTLGARTFDISHRYQDSLVPQSTPIRVTLNDDDTGSDSAGLSLLVNNIPPVVSVDSSVGPYVEGSPILLTADVVDGGGDTFSYDWIITKDGASFQRGNGSNLTLLPDDNALYGVALTVTDDEGAIGVASPLVLTVGNVSPQFVAPALTLYDVFGTPITTALEGDNITLVGTFTDPGIRDDQTVTVAWDDGTPVDVVRLRPGESSFAISHVYRDDPVGLLDEYEISVTVTDKDQGATPSTTKIATITNGAPVPSILDDGSDASTLRLNSSVVDPGTADVFTYAWSVKVDGSAINPGVPLDQATLSFALVPDTVYEVNLVVADDDGASGTSTTFVVSGSDDPDAITVTPVAGTNNVEVKVMTGGSTTVEEQVPNNVPIIINAFDSHDTITVDSGVTASVTADGGAGNDTVQGGSGDDMLTGGPGDDNLMGGAGDDQLFATEDNDTVAGDIGNDEYFLVPGSDKTLIEDVGEGVDTINFSLVELGGITLNLSVDDGTAQQVDTAENTVSLIGEFENLVGSNFADNFTGNDLNNEISTGDGSDTVEGGLGEDLIFGGTEADSLSGGQGNDTVDGGSGDDLIFGGMDTDSLAGGEGSDTIEGGEGNDLIFGGLDADTLTGGQGNDTIDGEGGNDLIFGGLDADTLTGGEGHDTIEGSSGNDLIFGGFDRDSLSGGDGNDTIQGESGDDLIFGGFDTDTLAGGEGNDTIQGDAGDDLIFGGSEADSLGGGEGSDTIQGDAGDDLIFGGLDTDTLSGGEGNDTIQGDEGHDLIFGGFDTDTLSGGEGNDTIQGDEGNDLIFGGTEADSLSGGEGNDTVDGGSGDDLIFGGLDADTLTGGQGSDTIEGGEANDLIFGGLDADTLTGGEGNDTVDGGSGDDLIFGGLDTDTLTGGEGSDTIEGGQGNDLIFGGLDADTLTGGEGNDSVDGGSGDDLIFGGLGTDSLTGGEGSDSIQGGDGNDLIFGQIGNDSLVGGAGNDLLEGGDGVDTLVGGDGDDQILGGNGGDSLLGGLGDDNIHGGSGDDIIQGGDGNDTITGGSGSDNLNGAGGAGAGFVDTLDDTALGGTLKLTDSEVIVGGATPITTMLANFSRAVLRGTELEDDIDATEFTGSVVMFGGPGNDTLRGTDLADRLEGQAGDDVLEGGLGNDVYGFVGVDLGADLVNEFSLPQPDDSHDTLDFFGLAGPITIDLGLETPQTVNPNLTLTLADGLGIEAVIGTPDRDDITGNARDNEIIGAGGQDLLNGAGGSDLVRAGIVKTVFLDFDTATDSATSGDNEREYEPAERDTVQRILEDDFQAFDIEFTQVRPTSGPFLTILFNETPFINGRFHAGGISELVGWRSLALAGIAVVDVNGFFGLGIDQARVENPIPLTTAGRNNFIQLSATIAAHELTHFYGVQHHDAMGPIGFGLFEQIGIDQFLPAYPVVVPTGAIETPSSLIASPASVRTTLADALNDPYLGERATIKFAFADTGSVLGEAEANTQTQLFFLNTDQDASTPAVETMVAYLDELPALTVPNTLQPEALNSEEDFDVQAINIVGSIVEATDGSSESDFYAFHARPGFLTVDLLSRTLRDRINETIDSVVRVYSAATGEKLDFYGSQFGAFNDDGIDNTDSLLLDVPIPAAGTYILEVDTFHFETPEFPEYAPPRFDVAAVCAASPTIDPCADTDVGDYEVLLYQFNTTDRLLLGSGDVLLGGDGPDQLAGSSGNDQFPDAGPDDTIDDASGLILGLSVDAGEDLSAVEGTPVDFTAVFHNQRAVATHSAVVLWGDGATETELTIDESNFEIQASHAYPDNGLYEVTVTVTDELGVTAEGRLTVAVSNADPSIESVSLPSTFVIGIPATLSAAANDPAGANDPLSYSWAITQPDGSVVPVSGASVDFIPALPGTHQYALLVKDDDGGTASLSGTFVVELTTGVYLTDRTLIVVGRDLKDNVRVIEKSGHINVSADFLQADEQFASGDVDAIFIFGGAGDDKLEVDRDLKIPSRIDGGPGNDKVEGGAGDDSLFGGPGDDKIRGRDGNDQLFGGAGDDKLDGDQGQDLIDGGPGDDDINTDTQDDANGIGDILLGQDGDDKISGSKARDMLVGGRGADDVKGKQGDDIVIGGFTAYDHEIAVLESIMAQWGSQLSYEARIANIAGTGPDPLSTPLWPATVHDDGAVDKLGGNNDNDWFFADLDGLDQDDDRVSSEPGEKIDQIFDL